MGAAGLETTPAIDRAALAGFEGNRGGASALGATDAEGRAAGVFSGEVAPPGSLALAAALGLVLEALLGKELLFASRKGKLLPTAYTGENLVRKRHPRTPHTGT